MTNVLEISDTINFTHNIKFVKNVEKDEERRKKRIFFIVNINYKQKKCI